MDRRKYLRTIGCAGATASLTGCMGSLLNNTRGQDNEPTDTPVPTPPTGANATPGKVWPTLIEDISSVSASAIDVEFEFICTLPRDARIDIHQYVAGEDSPLEIRSLANATSPAGTIGADNHWWLPPVKATGLGRKVGSVSVKNTWDGGEADTQRIRKTVRIEKPPIGKATVYQPVVVDTQLPNQPTRAYPEWPSNWVIRFNRLTRDNGTPTRDEVFAYERQGDITGLERVYHNCGLILDPGFEEETPDDISVQASRSSNYGLFSDIEGTDMMDTRPKRSLKFGYGHGMFDIPWSIEYKMNPREYRLSYHMQLTLPNRSKWENINQRIQIMRMYMDEDIMNAPPVERVARKLATVCEQIGATTPTQKLRVLLDFTQNTDYMSDYNYWKLGVERFGMEVPEIAPARTPTNTLMHLRGDCEDLTILFIALANSQSFNFNTVIGDMRRHTAPLVPFSELEVTEDDILNTTSTIEYNGEPYLYLESTYPAPLGERSFGPRDESKWDGIEVLAGPGKYATKDNHYEWGGYWI